MWVRFGTIFLMLGALALCGLMVYTITSGIDRDGFGPLDNRMPTNVNPIGVGAEIAVLLSEDEDWTQFRNAVALCAARGLGTVIPQPTNSTDTDGNEHVPERITIRTRKMGNLVHFQRGRISGGVSALRARTREMLLQPRPPLALVGADKSTTTIELIAALRDALAQQPHLNASAPLLLIPGASASKVEILRGQTPRILTDLYPGRTFRFCGNNRDEARLVVQRAFAKLSEDSPSPFAKPGAVEIIKDDDDQYSVDLTESFLSAFQNHFEILKRDSSAFVPPTVRVSSFPSEVPGMTDDKLEARAFALWSRAAALKDGEPLWLVLPLLKSLAIPLVDALQAHPARSAIPTGRKTPPQIWVLCGDSMNAKNLQQLKERPQFPIISVTAAGIPKHDSASASDSGLNDHPKLYYDGSFVMAEIVLALVYSLDQTVFSPSYDAGQLQAALVDLNLARNHPAAMGRSLRFLPEGERTGDDLYHVLLYLPENPGVIAQTRTPDGLWSKPVPVIVQTP